MITNHTTTTPGAANGLLVAVIQHGSNADDDTSIAIAIDLLRQRQLDRPEVREKLAAIEERNRYRKTRGAR